MDFGLGATDLGVGCQVLCDSLFWFLSFHGIVIIILSQFYYF